jgi:hypothetical protein
MGLVLSVAAAVVIQAALPVSTTDKLDLDSPVLSTWVDTENQEVVIRGGPFHLPAGTMAPGMMPGGEHSGGHGHDMHSRTPVMKVSWPIDGYLQGWKIRLRDSDGAAVSQEILHHFVGVNFSRRQLVYPVAERFLAVGQETADVELPDLVGLPLEAGTELGFYAMWSNLTGDDLDVNFELRLPYTEAEPALKVMPFYLDVNNVIGESSTFDLLPGENLKVFNFEVPVEGSLLMVGGHLHDLGKWVRLEDAETGEVLAQVDAEIGEAGAVLSIGRKILGYGEDAVYLETDHRYRLVAKYVNPMDQTMPDAAMAHMMGAFVPADYGDWPALDRDSEISKIDMAGLPPGELRVGALSSQR